MPVDFVSITTTLGDSTIQQLSYDWIERLKFSATNRDLIRQDHVFEIDKRNGDEIKRKAWNPRPMRND